MPHSKENKSNFSAEFEKFFSLSFDMLCIAGVDGYFKKLNPAFEQVLGYTREELLSKPFLDFIHSDDLPATLLEVEKLSKGIPTINFRNRYYCKDKSLKTLDWTCTSDPQTGMIYAIAKDVSEQIVLEKNLIKANTLKKAVLDSANFSIISTDPNGFIQTFNKTAERLLGYLADEVIGKITPQPFHDREEVIRRTEELNNEYNLNLEPGFETFVARTKITGLADEREWTYIRKDGTRFPVLLSITSLYNDDREITGFLGIAHDITEEKRKNEEINKLSLVAKNTENGVLISNSEGIVEWVNEGFTRITGYTLDEIVGKTPSSLLLGPNSNMETISYARKKQHAKEPYSIEILNYHKSGKPFWISIVNTPVKEENELKGKHIEIINDITEKKKTEFQLIRAKDIAEQSAKVKEQFLANMSHEIRTPMNSIIGFTELLMQSKLNSDQQDNVNAIRQAGENLTVIINDILDFSKIEAGKLNIEQTLFSFSEVIATIKNLFTLKAQQNNIKLIFNIDHKIPEALIGDAVRLDQVLINLVSNALKFTSKGWVEVSAELKSIAENRCIIQFKVEDTGIGIPKDKLDMVFQSFTQASNDTTRKYGGTGLGLTIVDQLVKLMGGTLYLKSNEGTGTLFSFTLEFEKGNEDEIAFVNKTPFSEQENKLTGMKILLCEDNEMNQRLVEKIIRKQWNATLDIASNGKAGFEFFKKNKYDVILMDVQMPEMDGFETTRRIRKYRDKSKSQTPIMAMTADALLEERNKCFEVGMNDYLSKPFKQGELFSKILNLTEKNGNTHILQSKEARVVNTESLRELTGDDDAFMAEMIEIYLRNTPSMLKELKSSFKKQDFETLKRMAHKLKSSLGMMGMNESLTIADSIEHFDESNVDQSILKLQIERLSDLISASLNELKKELQKLKK
ncbi:MAG: Sensor histidine kinase RcsC [Bacteroidia bacterium]|nr:Sensor histidine kinase RcsC [Bacteroidia bacterium]